MDQIRQTFQNIKEGCDLVTSNQRSLVTSLQFKKVIGPKGLLETLNNQVFEDNSPEGAEILESANNLVDDTQVTLIMREPQTKLLIMKVRQNTELVKTEVMKKNPTISEEVKKLINQIESQLDELTLSFMNVKNIPSIVETFQSDFVELKAKMMNLGFDSVKNIPSEGSNHSVKLPLPKFSGKQGERFDVYLSNLEHFFQIKNIQSEKSKRLFLEESLQEPAKSEITTGSNYQSAINILGMIYNAPGSEIIEFLNMCKNTENIKHQSHYELGIYLNKTSTMLDELKKSGSYNSLASLDVIGNILRPLPPGLKRSICGRISAEPDVRRQLDSIITVFKEESSTEFTQHKIEATFDKKKENVNNKPVTFVSAKVEKGKTFFTAINS